MAEDLLSQYIAVRDQLVQDVREVWALDPSQVHVVPMAVDPQGADYALVGRATTAEGFIPIQAEPENSVYDRLTITMAAVGRFRIQEGVCVDDEQIVKASQLRSRLQASPHYAVVAYLPLVVSMLDGIGVPDDDHYEVALTFRVQISATRTD